KLSIRMKNDTVPEYCVREALHVVGDQEVPRFRGRMCPSSLKETYRSARRCSHVNAPMVVRCPNQSRDILKDITAHAYAMKNALHFQQVICRQYLTHVKLLRVEPGHVC